MTWERRLLDLFDDLEQQAAGLSIGERDATVAELGPAGYAELALQDRVHDSLGRPLRLQLEGAGVVTGTAARVGSGWLLLAREPAPLVVMTSAVLVWRGLSPGARLADHRPRVAALTVGSVLRRLAEERQPVAVTLRSGEAVRGRLGRVGADFVEVEGPAGGPGADVLPWASMACLTASGGASAP